MVDVNVDFVLENDEPILADYTVEPDMTYTVDIVMSSSSSFHNDLYNRDLPNQHPISAITGLESALDGLSDDIVAENNRAIGVEEALDDKIDSEIDTRTDEITRVEGLISDEENRAKGVEQQLAGSIDSNHQAISSHVSDKNNPHEVTKAQVGLGNVENLAPADMPVSTATQTALNTKVDKVSTANKVYGTDAQGNQTTYDKGSFGQVDDVQVDGVSVVTNKIANLGSMASETASDYYTSAQVDTALSGKQDNLSAGTGIDINSNTVSVTDPTLVNNGTGTKALAVGKSSQSTAEGGVAVGYGSQANSTYSTAVGYESRATNTNTTVIGKGAKATQQRAIAIGSGAEANAQDSIAIKGINNTANTFQVYTYNMLDMSTGLIPDARISTNIARTSAIPSVDQTYDGTSSNAQSGTAVASAVSGEATLRQNADNGLQSQIDAIVSSSDVFDIVGTYAELQAYDISTVPVNDIIKVLVDSTHSGAATYYRCIETNNVKSWSYIGSEGAYYTKAESDNRFVPQTRMVNSKALSSDIILTASDVGALPSSTVIPTVNDSTVTIQTNGSTVSTFTLNQSSNETVNITVPTKTSDLTNDSGYITSASLPTVNNGQLDIQVNGSSVATFTANQSGNTTANIVVPDSATWGNITGDIADQTDLQDVLDDKQDKLTAGTDLEILNGSPLHNLPSGYTELEYIQSSGKQYLDTGVAYKDGIRVELDFQYVSCGSTAFTFGFNDYVGYLFYVANGVYTINISQNINYSASIYNKTHISATFNIVNSLPKITATIGNETKTFMRNNVGGIIYNLQIFTASGQTSNISTGRCYGVKVYDNDVLVMELVPAIRTSDNKVGMYDTVGNTFKTNSGTGSFIASAPAVEQTIINFTNDTGYITGINSTDVTTALGYTPVNPSSLSTVATSGSFNDLTNKPTVDQTYSASSTNAQSGVAVAQALSSIPTLTMTYTAATETLTWS